MHESLQEVADELIKWFGTFSNPETIMLTPMEEGEEPFSLAELIEDLREFTPRGIQEIDFYLFWRRGPLDLSIPLPLPTQWE